VGQMAKMQKTKNEWKILISTPQKKRIFDGHRFRWDNNIKISLENWACVYRLDSSASG
jgi:hypothetical protein